jgi:hypothetical protein
MHQHPAKIDHWRISHVTTSFIERRRNSHHVVDMNPPSAVLVDGRDQGVVIIAICARGLHVRTCEALKYPHRFGLSHVNN